MKFGVTGGEKLTRTFLEGITDAAPAESATATAQGRMRVCFPAKATLSDLPLEQKKAKVTLQLVVNTGNIQVKTVLNMDMKKTCSPVSRHVPGQMTDCPNTNSLRE